MFYTDNFLKIQNITQITDFGSYNNTSLILFSDINLTADVVNLLTFKHWHNIQKSSGNTYEIFGNNTVIFSLDCVFILKKTTLSMSSNWVLINRGLPPLYTALYTKMHF